MFDAVFRQRLDEIAKARSSSQIAVDARQDARPLFLEARTISGARVRVGRVAAGLTEDLCGCGALLPLAEGGLLLPGSSFEDRTAMLGRIAARLRSQTAFALSDDRLDLRDVGAHSDDAPVFAQMPRGLFRPLGAKTYAVRLTALIRPPQADCPSHFLFSRRSEKKRIGPGLWDSLAAGLVAAGESVRDALARESLEEAGLDLSRLSPAFCARTVFERPIAEGFLLEESFEYAIELPRSFSPYAVDGEVSAFAAFTAEETLELIEANRMMPEAAAAALRILQKAAAENASALSAV